MDGYISSSSPFLEIKYEPIDAATAPCADSERKITPWDLLARAGYWFRLLGVYAIINTGMAQVLYHVPGKTVLSWTFLGMVGHDAVGLLAPLFFLWIVALFFLPILPGAILLGLVWSFRIIRWAISRLDRWLFNGLCHLFWKPLGIRPRPAVGLIASLLELGLLAACAALAGKLAENF